MSALEKECRQRGEDARRRVLLHWVSIRVQPDVTCLSQLSDGQILTEILRLEDADSFLGLSTSRWRRGRRRKKCGSAEQTRVDKVVRYMESAMGRTGRTGNFKNASIQNILKGGEGILTFIQNIILNVVILKQLRIQCVRVDGLTDAFLTWINSTISECPAQNFTSDWSDGWRIWKFVRNTIIQRGYQSRWDGDWSNGSVLANINIALCNAENILGIDQLITAADLTFDGIPHICLITYLSQYLIPQSELFSKLRVKTQASSGSSNNYEEANFGGANPTSSVDYEHIDDFTRTGTARETEKEGDPTYFDSYALKYKSEVDPVALVALKNFPRRSYFLIKALKRPENFTIRKPAIKEGEFSQVFKAQLQDEKLLRVAAKCMKEKYKDNEVELIREAETMLKLNHAHIMPLSGLVLADDYKRWYLLQPWMSKGDLHQYVTENPQLTVAQLLACVADVVCAMETLEELDIEHRDLGARNCLVDKHGRVRVADFSFSRCVFQGPYVVKGELGFAYQWHAIEVLTAKTYSIKSDVWSFAVLLWEVLTRGESPYGEMSSTQVSMFLFKGGRLSKPGLATDELFSLMVECWDEFPEKRPTFEDIANILEIAAGNLDSDFVSKEPQIFSDREVVTIRKWKDSI